MGKKCADVYLNRMPLYVLCKTIFFKQIKSRKNVGSNCIYSSQQHKARNFSTIRTRYARVEKILKTGIEEGKNECKENGRMKMKMIQVNFT